jgi:serine/threonine-protein kinase HipA
MNTLDVLLDGVPVATLDGTAGAGLASLTYTQAALDTFPVGAPVLSVRLPVQAQPYPGVDTRAWMDGLVPEGDIRDVMAARRKLDRTDLFGLLRHYGRDCAGAVTIVDPGEDKAERHSNVRWLTTDELHRAIRDLPRAPFGIGISSKVRISLGGIQGKLAVVADDERIGLPEGLEPSTHILKPAPILLDGRERYPGIATAEAMSLNFCARLGLTVPRVRVLSLETGPALLIERYDRVRSTDGSVSRLHQEDLGQALGIISVNKYQEYKDTPSLRQLVEVLRQYGAATQRTLVELVGRIAAHALITNCDAHAKNWSVLLTGTEVALAPVYDVVPSTLWPDVDTTLALRVGDCGLLEDLRAADVVDEAATWGFGSRATRGALDRVSSTTAAAVDQALQDTVDVGGAPDVAACVADIIRAQAARFF